MKLFRLHQCCESSKSDYLGGHISSWHSNPSLRVFIPTVLEARQPVVQLVDAAVNYLSLSLRLQPHGFSFFVQQLHLPPQLTFQVLHPPQLVPTTSSSSSSSGAARRPAFLRHSRGVAASLDVRKWADV